MAESEKTTVIIPNFPRDLLDKFDRKIKGKYATRSEAFRDLARNFVEDNGLWRHNE